MQLNLPTPLDAEAQRTLDDLYWNSTCTAKSLAERFGVLSQRITKLVTPLPVGKECWWCRHALTWASRSERSSHRPLVCPDCRASTPSQVSDGRLQPSDAAIILTTSGHRTPKELSSDVGEGVSALAALGLGWSGCFTVVDVRGGPKTVRRDIAAIGTDTVVVPSVRALGVSQGDAFGAFRLLLQAELRVITARDIVWASASSGGYNQPYASRWSDYGSGQSYFDGWSDRSRDWAEEYDMLGLEDTRDDGEEYARRP